MTKRILSFLLVLVAILALAPQVQAEHNRDRDRGRRHRNDERYGRRDRRPFISIHIGGRGYGYGGRYRCEPGYPYYGFCDPYGYRVRRGYPVPVYVPVPVEQPGYPRYPQPQAEYRPEPTREEYPESQPTSSSMAYTVENATGFPVVVYATDGSSRMFSDGQTVQISALPKSAKVKKNGNWSVAGIEIDPDREGHFVVLAPAGD